MQPSDPNAPNPELAPGLRLLDRYSIVDRVGSGGMATIYRANDERLDRIVCVKLLRLVLEGADHEGTGSSSVYQATYTHFLQEALALSKLQHPNTLRIYDFGYTDDGRPFQISEFLDGGNLETQVKASVRFNQVETLGVLERICGAIAEAHQHGIIHRDIKPSNILFARVAGLTPADERPEIGHALMPKLADFGIASSHLRKAGEVESASGAVSSVALFSPRWAAPEQLSGSPEGPTTDVYALGLVTAFMLGGRAPFADPDARAHFDDRISSDAFATARLAGLGLDERARSVLLRAMAANPARRTASPLAFFDELRDAFRARPPEPGKVRRPFDSITLVIETDGREAQAVAPVERAVSVGGRSVRVVDVNEKLDFTVTTQGDPGPGAPSEPRVVRFRATLLPAAPQAKEGFALQLKGLNCFVARAGGRPTPAITAYEDGSLAFVSGDREALCDATWSFGLPTADLGAGAGRVFDLGAGELVVPYIEASQAVAIDLGPAREVIVMCRRS